MSPQMAAALLGVREDADATAVKYAYRKRALESHPDRGGDPERFRLYTEAYEVLRQKGPTTTMPSAEEIVLDLPPVVRRVAEKLSDKKNQGTLRRLLGRENADLVSAVAGLLLQAPEVAKDLQQQRSKKKKRKKDPQ